VPGTELAHLNVILVVEDQMAAKLSPAELAEFRRQLLDREQQLIRELEAGRQRASVESFTQIAGEARDVGDASLADATTDAVNAERERDSSELREVQAALERIDAGTYGLCMKCGEPIDPQRLKALPTARYDVQHEAERERREGQPNPPTL
jgi:RNA polymerase-binding transcription factor DksA